MLTMSTVPVFRAIVSYFILKYAKHKNFTGTLSKLRNILAAMMEGGGRFIASVGRPCCCTCKYYAYFDQSGDALGDRIFINNFLLYLPVRCNAIIVNVSVLVLKNKRIPLRRRVLRMYRPGPSYTLLPRLKRKQLREQNADVSNRFTFSSVR